MPKTVFGNKLQIRFPEDARPQLVVVIDTEEEFDWSANPDPNATAVSAMAYISRAQEIFDEYGVVPCYVVDYPVVSKEQGYAELVEIAQQQRCEIGAHLHPWVTEPVSETISTRNSFPGNLPPELERDKLINLINKIESVFGHKPKAYKAGRYGLGPNTASILSQLGIHIDLSSCPPMNYSGEDGPNYTHSQSQPFWFGDNHELLEIPCSGAFIGWGGGYKAAIHQFAERFPKLRLNGIASRLGIVDRLRLSPEGYTIDEQIKLTNALHADGVRIFNWSFHSTSVVAGMTGYVKTEQELTQFLDSFRRYFDYFFGELNGVAATPTEVYRYCLEQGNQ